MILCACAHVISHSYALLHYYQGIAWKYGVIRYMDWIYIFIT